MKSNMKKEKTIEEAILEIEKLTQKIEEEDLPIDDVVQTYKAGMEMIAKIKTQIADITNEIEEIKLGGK